MNKDDIEDMDEEIESAVDSLFVEEVADSGFGQGGGEKSIPEQAEPIPDISPEVMEESLGREEFGEPPLEAEPIEEEMAPAAEEAEPIEEEMVSSAEEAEPMEKPPEDERLPKCVETL